MYKSLLAGVAIGALLCTSTVMAAEKMRIATDVPYLPMEYQTPNGDLEGFDIDIGNAICQQAELECSFQVQNWDGIITGLQSRKYDAIMAAMTITENRGKHVLFSDPYVVVGSAFYVTKDSAVDSLDKEALAGKHIGVQRGTTQDDYVTAMYGDVADIKRYAAADDVVNDLGNGRLDAVFFDTYTGVSALLEEHADKYRQLGDLITKPQDILGIGVGAAFRKSDKKLAKKFNNALAAIRKNGVYDKIFDKYFGEDSNQDAMKP